ncbi:MAG: xanthine dehydrogenase family protein subunit M [Pseudomonadota bacterium]
MYEAKYHKPASLTDAATALAGSSDGAVLAGGQTLLPTMKQHLAAPSDLIDVRAIDAMRGITVSEGAVTIGAATTHAEVAGSAVVRENIPALACLAGGIGDPAVRHMGTMGGSVANNDPAADYPAAVLGLGATVVTTSREIPADEFFAGLFSTDLEDGEIITQIRFPIAARAGYSKFPNPASRYALVGVFVAETGGAIRVAVTGAGADGVFRHSGMEAALATTVSTSVLDDVAVDAGDLVSDIHASAEYRAHLVTVMAKRAVEALS